MLADTELLQDCKKKIEQKLDWGDSEQWQTADFENLQQRIFDETGVSLSSSTLRRIWGRTKYEHLPSTTTLNTLAKFAGFESWRLFARYANKHSNPSITEHLLTETKKPFVRRQMKLAAIVTGLLIVGLFFVIALRWSDRPVNKDAYQFSAELITREIPNSVVFTYDATASPTDSVYIQQSWDPRRRVPVDKALQKHTSVYYEPGFFQAKLIVGNEVVKEHRLLIPTDGWLGAILTNNAVPVYLKLKSIIDGDTMRVRLSEFSNHNIPMQPQTPMIKFFNVGNFDPVPISDFSFSSEVKNEYAEGSAACQMTYVMLITDDAPIVIGLSAKGCISELSLISIDHMISGKKADLSGFGVDFSEWIDVECKTAGNNIEYWINKKMVYKLSLPTKPVNIVGIAYGFQGTGAVKAVRLSKAGRVVFGL